MVLDLDLCENHQRSIDESFNYDTIINIVIIDYNAFLHSGNLDLGTSRLSAPSAVSTCQAKITLHRGVRLVMSS